MFDESTIEEVSADPERSEPEPRFLGMTTGQRFILSILLFATAAILGFTCLLVTGRVWF